MNILFIHNNNLPRPLTRMIYESTLKDHSFSVLPISQAATDRDDYDTFLDRTLHSSDLVEYDLIVLPLSLSSINPLEYTGIRCAAHIRLDKRYNNTRTPILFLGPDSIDEILSLSEIGSLLLSPCVFLSNANTVELFNNWLMQTLPVINRLSDTDYQRFLNRFEVTPPANYADDHHSIANLWGAIILSRRITRDPIPHTNADNEALRSLFFKYVLAKQDITEDINNTNRNETDSLAIGKRFLLIDDEANKGWAFALSHYLHGASKFDVISEKVSKYDELPESNRTQIENGDYDVIFLDLRLNGPDEECNIDPELFSGMDVLHRIKEINQGTQVIMFTASNKAWNLKALLDAGADGYYIKQSPDYYTDKSADNNFLSLKETIRYCLTRTFLKTVYQRISNLYEVCENAIDEEFYTPIEKYLDQSFILLSTAGNNTQYKYAFLSLFGALEEVVKYWIIPTRKDKPLYFFDDARVNAWDIDKQGRKFYINGLANGDFAISRRIVAIYQDRLGGMDMEFAKRIYNLVARRNDFVHNSVSQLPYPSIKTPELGDRHSYEDLFEVVELVIEDCFQ